MRINYSYHYQDFPGADWLTSISMLIGKLTSAPWVVFYTLIIYVILGNADLAINKGFFSVITLFLVPLLVYFILRFLRTQAGKILNKKYVAKLNALKETNPAEYYQIMLELQKRQSGK